MAEEGIIRVEIESDGDDDQNIIGKEIDVEIGNDVITKYEKNLSGERRRRRKEMQLYDDLLELLPQLPLTAHKADILKEAKSSIETLKQTLESLERQKLQKLHNVYTNTNMASLGPSQSLPVANNEASFSHNGANYMMSLNTISSQNSVIFKTWTSSNVTLNVCGNDAVINICSLKNPHLFSEVCFILKKHHLEVVFAQIYSHHATTLYMIRLHGIVLPPEYATEFPYEERCKSAMAEIVQLVNLGQTS